MGRKFAALAAALILFLLAGCSGQQPDGSAPYSADPRAALVPPKAATYVIMDVQGVLADAELRDALGASGQDAEAQFKIFSENVGIDAEDAKSTLVFSDEAGGYGAMVVYADYDKGAVLSRVREAAAKRGAPFEVGEFEGATLVSTADAKGNESALAFVNSDAIAYGKKDAVEDVVLVAKGKLAPFSDKNADRALARVKRDGVMVVVSKAGVQAGAAASPVLAMAMSVGRAGRQIEVKNAMVFASAAMAAQAGQQMEGLASFSMSAMAREGAAGSAYARVISGMKTGLDGDTLTVSFLIEPEDLKAMKEESGKGGGTGSLYIPVQAG